VQWKGRPLEHWLARMGGRPGLTMATRCVICDLAFAMGLSEQAFYRRFDPFERAQLLATYRSQLDRQSVMATFPVRRKE